MCPREVMAGKYGIQRIFVILCGKTVLLMMRPAALRLLYCLILPAVALFAVAACGEKPRMDLDSLGRLWDGYYERMEIDSVLLSAKKVHEKAVSAGDDEAAMFSAMYAAQCYLAEPRYDSAYMWMEPYEKDVERKGNSELRIILYNMKAIVALSQDTDYSSGLEYFKKALDIAEKMGDKKLSLTILANMSKVFFIRKDTSGMAYAEKAWRLSREVGSLPERSSAVAFMVRMSILKHDLKNALIYVEELREMYEGGGVPLYGFLAYSLTAEIMEDSGRLQEAGKAYDAAMSLADDVSSVYVIECCLKYGRYLAGQDSLDKSVGILSRGLEQSRRSGHYQWMGNLLSSLSDVYGRMGDKDKAYDYYQQYDVFFKQQMADERKFNTLQLRMETMRHDQELSAIRAKVFFGVVLIMVVLVSVLVLYWRKSRMYRQIVENHYRLSQALNEAIAGKAEAESALAQDRKRKPDEALWNGIEGLMRNEKLYRSKDVSLERIADVLDTNVKYVSNAINAHSGKSFYNYINGYRIAEAVAVLQDVDNDTPLKALCEDLGFNSLSVFYRAFQNETGVPPARYRNEVRRMKRNMAAV